MRTLGDAPPRKTLTPEARRRLDLVVLDVVGRVEAVDLAQHARDRRAEREDIELGWLDLGEVGA